MAAEITFLIVSIVVVLALLVWMNYLHHSRLRKRVIAQLCEALTHGYRITGVSEDDTKALCIVEMKFHGKFCVLSYGPRDDTGFRELDIEREFAQPEAAIAFADTIIEMERWECV